jgi:hypothetical protein
VTIAGDYQGASIVNPGRPVRKGERETLTIKLGGKIGEYKLAKVLSDRITLEAEEDTFEVLLYDPKMPKKRVDIKTDSKPVTITSAQASSTPTTDIKGVSGLPKDTGTSPSTSASKPVIRKEAVGETKESSQQQPSTQTSMPVTSPPAYMPTSWPAPIPTQVPFPTAPTPTQTQFLPVPGSVIPPPDMGRPVPLPSGGPAQQPSTGGK